MGSGQLWRAAGDIRAWAGQADRSLQHLNVIDRRPLDASAFSLMTLLCSLWGVQQVVVKLTAPYMSLVMQGGIRSLLAAVLVLVWARAEHSVVLS